MTCKNCGKPIDFSPMPIPCLQWKHANGHYGCNESVPTHSLTYAEPMKQDIEPQKGRGL